MNIRSRIVAVCKNLIVGILVSINTFICLSYQRGYELAAQSISTCLEPFFQVVLNLVPCQNRWILWIRSPWLPSSSSPISKPSLLKWSKMVFWVSLQSRCATAIWSLTEFEILEVSVFNICSKTCRKSLEKLIDPLKNAGDWSVLSKYPIIQFYKLLDSRYWPPVVPTSKPIPWITHHGSHLHHGVAWVDLLALSKDQLKLAQHSFVKPKVCCGSRAIVKPSQVTIFMGAIMLSIINSKTSGTPNASILIFQPPLGRTGGHWRLHLSWLRVAPIHLQPLSSSSFEAAVEQISPNKYVPSTLNCIKRPTNTWFTQKTCWWMADVWCVQDVPQLCLTTKRPNG